MKKCKSDEVTYIKLKIPKKDGSYRTVYAPNEKLKRRQREILKQLYKLNYDFPFANGFLPNKNIIRNSYPHLHKKYILNIDIKDFFLHCTIYNMPEKVRECLQQLGVKEEEVFYEEHLVQGAPTSPYLSNFYLEEVDRCIFNMLRAFISDDVNYSRYADDITISSNSKAIFSNTTLRIIKDCLWKDGFRINEQKIRRLTPSSRKEVTGVIVNSGKPTISRQIRRKIRAALHYLKTGKEPLQPISTIRGWLSYLQQFDTHKDWAREKMKELEMILKGGAK